MVDFEIQMPRPIIQVPLPRWPGETTTGDIRISSKSFIEIVSMWIPDPSASLRALRYCSWESSRVRAIDPEDESRPSALERKKEWAALPSGIERAEQVTSLPFLCRLNGSSGFRFSIYSWFGWWRLKLDFELKDTHAALSRGTGFLSSLSELQPGVWGRKESCPCYFGSSA